LVGEKEEDVREMVFPAEEERRMAPDQRRDSRGADRDSEDRSGEGKDSQVSSLEELQDKKRDAREIPFQRDTSSAETKPPHDLLRYLLLHHLTVLFLTILFLLLTLSSVLSAIAIGPLASHL
jgi:hypothetical protein